MALTTAVALTPAARPNAAEAWALADRLLILIDGRLVAAGPPRDLLEQPPRIDVARFLGFDGSLDDGIEVVLTRPAHVVLDPSGPLAARVRRAIPLEDGVRLELELDHGRLYTVAPLPAPGPGRRNPGANRGRRPLRAVPDAQRRPAY